MPNRVLRDYTNSEKVNKLSFNAEVFFVRLMMKADDYGRFYGNEKLLKSNLFPFRVDSIKDDQILKWKQECVDFGLLNQYSVNDKDYIEINDFRQRLRLMLSKFPAPPTNDGQMTADCQSNDGLKRNRNETEEETETESVKSEIEIFPTFNDFYELYEKKVDKEISQKKWTKLSQAEKERAMIHTEYYKKLQPDPKFRKSPAAYITQKTFNDDIQPITEPRQQPKFTKVKPTRAERQGENAKQAYFERLERNSQTG